MLVSMTAEPHEARMAETSVRVIAQVTQPRARRLTTPAELVDGGVVTPHLDRVFPIDQTEDASTYNETQRPRGKVVVEVRER